MAMPVNFHVILFDNFFFDELDECPNAIWRRVPNCIGETDSSCAALNRRTVQRLDCFRPGPRRVFRDVHDRQTMPHGVGDRFLGRGNDAVHRPILCILPDRGGADERGRFDLDPDLVCNPYDRLDIGDDGPRGAIRGDRELVVADLLGEGSHLLDDTGTRPRQADIGGDDTEVRHQVQQPLFDVERWIGDRRGLQAVAQGLVVQFNPGTGPIEAAVYTRAVPVVDKLALIHPFSIVRHNG